MVNWKQKLLAFLHDPPSKCVDLRFHEQRSERAMLAAGFSTEECRAFSKLADTTASSADRFPFPRSDAARLSCHFDGERAGFHHPLGGERGTQSVLRFPQPVTGFEAIEGQLQEHEQTVQPVLTSWPDQWSEDRVWQARFFAHWRLWPTHAAELDGRFAFLPADTRLPDHTIWSHMGVVSALAGCVEVGPGWEAASIEEWVKMLRHAPPRPAFLKLQLGGVQEFIAQARSTRDLWSGSYLLSWLMAAGLKALSEKIGPDAVIYPNLRGQPLFDLHWRDDLWSQIHIGDRSVWESMGLTDSELLTPNLPNVLLAVVPAVCADELARIATQTIQNEWANITRSVWEKVSGSGLLDLSPLSFDEAKRRLFAQAQRLLTPAWQVFTWPKTLAEARMLAEKLPSDAELEPGEKTLLERFDAVVAAATRHTPKDHRDGRYFVGGDASLKDTLNNIGLGWSLALAATSWSLDAVRQTRAFDAWATGGWDRTGVAQSKDALTGREEMLFGGYSDFAEDVRKRCGEPWATVFKHNDEVGALTLIKRIWHFAYLAGERWKLRASFRDFKMPNTRGIADHDPFAKNPENDAEESVEQAPDEESTGKYFAVLALDGDQIGQWVSGDKAPRFRTQLADYADAQGTQRQGSLEYFERDSDPDEQGKTLKERFADFLDTRRLVSPSYHLQFSEALSNFALFCAWPIVEAFDGRLIYAGGDDVVALLPADTALACAQALRAAFTGLSVPNPAGGELFQSPAPGFLASEQRKDRHGNGVPIPFLVPGPAADCSVGIAIAHFKAPLQDVVRAAQAAEKRAKKQLGRSAVAVTLIKRSGEIIEWGVKWTNGLELYRALADALEAEQLSAKFPHRWAELLGAYLTETTPLVRDAKTIEPVEQFPVDEIIRREFDHTLSRQRGAKFPKEPAALEELRAKLRAALADHLQSLDVAKKAKPEDRLQALIGLCQTVAFAHRTAENGSPSASSASSVVSTPQAERQPA